MEAKRAFVLYSMDYKDSGKILYLYTEHGQQSVLAHGVKKLSSINRFLSQNGTEISLTMTNASFPSMRDGELVHEYKHIKEDLVSYTYMNHVLELVRHTVSEDLDHPKMYRFLQKIFALMEAGNDPEILTFVFEFKLLYFIGNGLHLRSCTSCGKTENLVFHISSGGLTCKEHLTTDQTYYESDIFHLIMLLYYIDLDTTELPQIAPNQRILLRHILDLLYQEFVSFESKSRSILRQIKKY
jgi:DNA repair protein RecO (recombination protein O)